MKRALRKKRRFLQMLSRRSFDLRLQVVVPIEMLLACFRKGGFGAASESFEFDEAKRALIALLRCAKRLNEMKLWQWLRISRTKMDVVRITSYEQRNEALGDLAADLRDVFGTRGDIVGGLYALHEVVASMQQMFAVGRAMKLEEDTWLLERYTCAALLPTFVEQFQRFWRELQENMITGMPKRDG